MKFLLSSAKYGLRLRLLLPSLSPSSLLFNYRLTSSLSSSSSSLSASSSAYEIFFPGFYGKYVSNMVDWFTSEKSEDRVPKSFGLNCKELRHRFPEFYEKPDYMHTLNGMFEPIPIQVGQHFDVISLLSTHGDDLVRIGYNNNEIDLVKVDNLRGKYVLLCCAFLPLHWMAYDSFTFRLLSTQLSYMGLVSNFEIVFVPMMRRKWDNDEGVFNHFCSAFPGCLVVPFAHKYRRNYICKSLNFEGEEKGILFNPSHKVLQDEIVWILNNGINGYNHLMFLGYQHSFNPCTKSLAGLLSCESNPSFLLHKLGSEETISVEQLNKHYVVLYLFRQGCCFKILQNVYQQCRDQGLDFEVVLVCIPFDTSIHPEMFQDIVHCAMKKHQVLDWWFFPYNQSACLKLKFLCDLDSGEHIVVVGPQNKFVEMEAGKVLDLYALHFGPEAYPFTKKALLQNLLQRLGTITLESFLTYEYVYRDYKCDEGERMPVSELKGKNVLVYVDNARCFAGKCGEKVNHWYNVIKEKDPSFEVVFVPFIDPNHDSEYHQVPSINATRELISESKTKWLVCPFDDPIHSQFLMNHDAFLFRWGTKTTRKGLPIPSVVAFSEDGHLYSLDALRLLRFNGLNAYPFLSQSRNRNLCDEIYSILRSEFNLNLHGVADLGENMHVSSIYEWIPC